MNTRYILIIILFILSSCGSKKDDKNTAKPPSTADSTGNMATLTNAQLQTAGVQTDTLQKKLLSSVIKVNGSIDVPPQNMVSVSAPLGGYLRTTQLLPGLHVNKGQSIAVLEDIQYIQMEQDYLTTQAQLAYDEKEYERQKELNKSKASSDKAFQQAEAEYDSRRVTLNALAEKLRLINVNPAHLSPGTISKTVNLVAPISGFVSKVNVNIGKYVSPTDVLFELVNPSDIHLNLVVFEKDVDKLSIGQELYAYTNDQPNKKYKCKIILISHDISPERTVEVHCHFKDFDNSLLPGMYMNAEIQVKGSELYAVPDESVVNFEAKDYVFTDMGDHKYKMTHVTTGISQNGYTEIKNWDSLQQKQIVTKGAYTVLMKLKNTGGEDD